MYRRNSDRRKSETTSKSQKIIATATLLISLVSLVVSLNNRSMIESVVAMVNQIQVEPVAQEVQEVQPIKQTAEQPIMRVQKSRPKVDSKRQVKERVTRGPKRVRVIFEESVARAPAAVEQPANHETKTIKYSNDLYEKEDLL